MSGGTFDYKQYSMRDIAETIISRCEHAKQIGSLSKETIYSLLESAKYILIAEVKAQRADWLFAGDDGEDTYHKRLNDDLYNLLISDEYKEMHEIKTTEPCPETKLTKLKDNKTGLIHVFYNDYSSLCNTKINSLFLDFTNEKPTCPKCLEAIQKIKDDWKNLSE